MKKLIALALTLIMLLSAATAFAEEIPEINWADVEASIAESNIDGEFYTLDAVDSKFWIPSVMLECELTEEDLADGYIAYFVTEDETAVVSVVYVDVEGMSLDEYAELLVEAGATDIENVIINGCSALSYNLTEENTGCIAIATEAGFILEFAFSPIDDEGFLAISSIIISSIQSAE